MNLSRLGLVLSIALFVLVGPGCGSTGGNGGSGGSTDSGGSVPTGSPGVGMRVGSSDQFDPAARSKMNAAWEAFKKDSPDWPRLRAEWVGLGARATNTLVENLFRAMVLSRLRNFPEGIRRSRLELVKLGEHAVPTLAGVLKEPYFGDPSLGGRKAPLTTGIVTDVAEILSLATPASLRPLTELSRSRNKGVKRECILALGKSQHPSAIPVLSDRLDSSDWLDRVAAATALGLSGSPQAVRPLISALGDSEEGVVEEAARSLVKLKARSAVGALESRRESARSAGRHSVAAACGSAAKAIRSSR